MQENLMFYLKKYEGFLNKPECIMSVDGLKMSNWTKHKFYDSKTNQYISRVGDKELSITFDGVCDDYIMNRFWLATERYILKDMNFSWFNGWSGFTKVRYNRYQEDELMDVHCDQIRDIFDGQRRGIPIITILGILNDDYVGGEFEICGKIIDCKMGDVFVFPSNFLYPHKVHPVKQGTRYSCVSWVW